jgi:hypothetical protein
MPRGALVVNRFHVPPPHREGVTERDAADGIATYALTLEEEAPARIVRAHEDAVKLAALDVAHLRALAEPGRLPVVRVAELDTDVQDLTLLAQLSDVLVAGGV